MINEIYWYDPVNDTWIDCDGSDINIFDYVDPCYIEIFMYAQCDQSFLITPLRTVELIWGEIDEPPL